MKYLLMKAVDNNNFGIDVGVLEVAAIPDNLEHAIKHMKLRAHEHCFILKFDETAIPSVKHRLQAIKDAEEELARRNAAKAISDEAEARANDMMVDRLIEKLLSTKSKGVDKSGPLPSMGEPQLPPQTPPKAGN